MSTRDEEFNWRESLERMGQAAMDLLTGLGGRVGSGEGVAPSGNEITESRAVSGFTQIKLAGIGTLNIEQADADSLKITADEALMPHLTSEVVGDTLELGMTPHLTLHRRPRIIYTVTVKNLTGIQLTGAGMVNAHGIHTDTMSVTMSGAGDMTLSGDARVQKLKITGAGNYHAHEFQTDEADVLISGAGNAHINANSTLDATVSGAGSVTYYGSPRISQRITGIGSVKPGR